MLDPISAAILLGIVASARTVASEAVEDAYSGLKGLLAHKLGKESEAVEAVEKLEKQPDRDDRKATVVAELQAAGVGDDAELLATAERLQAALDTLPEEARAGVQHAVGNYIAQASGGSTATVNVGRDAPPPGRAGVVA